MGCVRCLKASCPHNRGGVCRKGQGYDYGGGDITISPRGFCTGSKKEKKHA